MRFFVDGFMIGEVIPPAGGFWELGQLDRDPGGPNIWANGTKMTPFDYPVSSLVVFYMRFKYVIKHNAQKDLLPLVLSDVMENSCFRLYLNSCIFTNSSFILFSTLRSEVTFSLTDAPIDPFRNLGRLSISVPVNNQ